MASKNDRMYGLNNWEDLEWDVEAVIERVIVDACETEAEESFDAIASRITWPIRVKVYKRMDLPSTERLAGWAIDAIFEGLDGEYANPYEDSSLTSEAIKAAALALGEAFRADYSQWACEVTGEVIEVTREQAKELSDD